MDSPEDSGREAPAGPEGLIKALAAFGAEPPAIAAAAGLTEAELHARHGRLMAEARANVRAQLRQKLWHTAMHGQGKDAIEAAKALDLMLARGGVAAPPGPVAAPPGPVAAAPDEAAPPAAPADAPALTCNMQEMADKLGVSLPTFRALLTRYEDFPVLSRGTNGRAWAFDPHAVIAFIAERKREEEAANAQREELLGQIALPFEAPRDEAGRAIEIAELGQLYRLATQADEFALARRQLLRVEEVRPPLIEAAARLRSAALALPRRWREKHNLPQAVAADLRTDLEQWLTNFVDEARAHLLVTLPPGDGDPDEAAAAAA